MKPERKEQVLIRLLDKLTSLINEYHSSLEQDKVFEVRKAIRIRIKKIQHQIQDLKGLHDVPIEEVIKKWN